jgi:AcrR family transcriptional regulator
MGRTIGSSGPATFEAIRRAGLELIYRHGYDAMSLRQLASEIGLVQGSLYNHISTKQELLFILIRDHMKDLLAHADEAMAGIEDPMDQLVCFVEFHVNYHVDRKREVFISYSELRSLEPKNFDAVVAMRRQYENKLISILRAGAAKGMFTISDPQVTAYGIVSMLAGICNWFDPKGRLSKKQIAKIFVQMVLGAVHCNEAESTKKPLKSAASASMRLIRS